MIKKVVAYIIILLAGFIITAHDLVLHHHHEDINIENATNITIENEEEHPHDFPKHQHFENDTYFLIRQAYASSPIANKIPNDFDNNSFDSLFTKDLEYLYQYFSLQEKVPKWDNYVFPLKNKSLTFGLRAPPLV